MSEDKHAAAREQAYAQFNSIREMVDALEIAPWKGAAEAEGWTYGTARMTGNPRFEHPEHGFFMCDGWQDLCEEFGIDPENYRAADAAVEDARRAIEEDALSVEIRSDWYNPGSIDKPEPAEFRILLCTGGPAVQIIGDLDEHGQPENPRLQCQDWFIPWQDVPRPDGVDYETWERVLLTYCQQFYFGEG